MSHVAGDATPAPKFNQRLWDLKITCLSAEGKQTLLCSAMASPGCSFRTEILAKSNKSINHWEHPSWPQGRDGFISRGWSGAQMLRGFYLPCVAMRGRDRPGSRVGTGFVRLLLNCTCAGFRSRLFSFHTAGCTHQSPRGCFSVLRRYLSSAAGRSERLE